MHIAVLRFKLAERRSFNEKRIALGAKSFFRLVTTPRPDIFANKLVRICLFKRSFTPGHKYVLFKRTSKCVCSKLKVTFLRRS